MKVMCQPSEIEVCVSEVLRQFESELKIRGALHPKCFLENGFWWRIVKESNGMDYDRYKQKQRQATEDEVSAMVGLQALAKLLISSNGK